jgi:hypothetical protein
MTDPALVFLPSPPTPALSHAHSLPTTADSFKTAGNTTFSITSIRCHLLLLQDPNLCHLLLRWLLSAA